MPSLQELYIHDIKIKNLHLQNFRGFGSLDITFSSEDEKKSVTVIIANNGGGKSTILDAIAEMLRKFLHMGISREDTYISPLSERDIFNERNNSIISCTFNISYPQPNKEVFKFMDICAKWLNENYIDGEEAIITLDKDEAWILEIVKHGKNIFTYYLPDKLKDALKLTSSDEIEAPNLNMKVCLKYDEDWVINHNISLYEIKKHIINKGDIEIKCELTRTNKKESARYHVNPQKPSSYEELVYIWNSGQAIIQDFYNSAKRYSSSSTLNESPIILPLLAYYGGVAIKAKYDNYLKVPYKAGEFQAYQHALDPERFDFEEFLTWSLWISEKQKYAWELVKLVILDVLNAEQPQYKDIRLETQTLYLVKNIAPNVEPIAIEAAQLSAGEQNIMALFGDLVKRAIQLNPILFKIDYDSNVGTLSNPLHYTTGIVLIDEIDLHLHPKWQRIVIPKLKEHFPQIHFIVTTHSPFVLQYTEPEESRIIYLNEFNCKDISETPRFGRQLQDIAYVFQNVSYRPKKIKEKINYIYDLIDEGMLQKAKIETDELAMILSESDAEIIKIRTIIEFYSNDGF